MSISLAEYMGHAVTRPLNNVENEAEIHAYFDSDLVNAAEPRARLECAWCGERTRSTRNPAIAWFLTHACAVDAERAAANRAIRAEHDMEHVNALLAA